MPELRWHKMAKADLWRIGNYIASDNPEAAFDLANEIRTKANELAKFPQMYKEGRMHGTREMVVRGNYLVIYTVDANSVSILRIKHTAQQWP